MKIALFAADYEILRYAREFASLQDDEWVGSFLTSGRPETFSAAETAVLPAFYSSADRLAETADLVVMGGDPSCRFDYVARFLRKGKAVWSDWPVSPVYAETCKLAALAEEAKVCNQVAHGGRRHPLWVASRPYWRNARMIRTDICRPVGDLGINRIEEILVPYIDRVLSVTDEPLKRVRSRKVKVGGRGNFSVWIEIEFSSGLMAEFWIDNVSASVSEKMRCIGADAVVDLDFFTFELRVEEADRAEERLTSLERETERFAKSFLAEDLQGFTDACRNGRQERPDFSHSGKLQDVLGQINRSLQYYE